MRVFCIVLTFVSAIRACKDVCVDDKRNYDRCNLEGSWQNQDCSEMILEKRGSLFYAGSYFSGVDSPKKKLSVEVFLHPNKPRIFIMNVMGLNENVVTWTGQCYRVKDGRGEKEVLMTMWFDTTYSTCENEWKSTVIGKDVFERLNNSDDPDDPEDPNRPHDPDDPDTPDDPDFWND